MRRVAALVTTFTLWLAFPAAAGGPNQVVQSSPTTDGDKIYRTGVQATSTGAETITSSNVALARPSGCTGCEGIAVAYQAVVVTGNPSEASPRNAAVAVNTECTDCGAFAYAYQYVVSADSGTYLSSAAREKIRGVRTKATELVHAGLAYDELETRLKELAVEFKSIVVNDLERTGGDPTGGVPDTEVDEEAPAS